MVAFKFEFFLTFLKSLVRIGTKIGTILGRLIKIKDFIIVRAITDIFDSNISMIGSVTADTGEGDMVRG